MPTQTAYLTILEILERHSIDYIVVGGVCAVAHGAPVTTFDLDVLYEMDGGNIDRILAALKEMEAFHREPGSRKLLPQRPTLESGGPALFATKFGSLGFLGDLSGRKLADFAEHTVELTLSSGLQLRMLDLEILIAVKEHAGRPKDIAVLPILRQALLELSRRE